MNNIRWDTKKHDESVGEVEKARIQFQAGKIYTAFKNRVLKLPKHKRNRSEVVKLLVGMREELAKLSDAPGLGDWKAYTLDVADFVIERANVTLGITPNTLVEYVPSFVDRRPTETTFTGLPELYRIEFVQRIVKKEGFGGLLRKGHELIAMFDDGELVPVGIVKHPEGLMIIPTLESYQKALVASGPAAAGGDPTETGPESSGGATSGPSDPARN